MRKINRYFFEETNNLHDEIISLYDFILPTATALWQFRRVIEEEVKAEPTPKVSDLSQKYNTAPGTRGSTNLITPFLTHTWDTQRERLAEITLVNIIAIYEIWCDEICDLFNRKELSLRLQFPSNHQNTDGVMSVLYELTLHPSSVTHDAFYNGLTSSKKYSIYTFNNRLKCFRYFKDLRNCFIHRGRTCDNKLYGWQSHFIPVADKTSLGMEFVPNYVRTNIGDRVQLDLHGCLGFTDVILRIVTTIDAELSQTNIGEHVFVSRIATYSPGPIPMAKLPKLFDTMGLKSSVIGPSLLQLLKGKGVVA